ncbi:hypothetical protein F66182_9979 [Fusarium sp. NRRL 66182]|nr:hypothetical protein F66182_9979 [Fusarium sp. NRRL 66182]
MIVSKPCQHPECPPRQGIIRGYYESVEVIREVPVDNFVSKRSLSSADLLDREEVRIPSPKPGSEGHGSMPLDEPSTAVEWLMVTRSDPGGSVPRFLIEKGTPPGIVGDAGKFLKWVTSKAMHGFPDPNEVPEVNEGTERKEKVELGKEESSAMPAPTTNIERANIERVVVPPDQNDPFPNSNGLYGVIAGAIGAASSYIPASLLKTWGNSSDVASTDETVSDTRALAEERRDDEDSDTSSIRSFASALERSVTAENKSPDSMAESQSQSETSPSATQQSQADKELKKLQHKRKKLDEKVARLEERRQSKLQGEKEKDAATLAKMREKHERELAKQEEKYRREVRKLEEKREREQRKAEERRRKASEQEEKHNLSLELERVRAERDVARRQIELLEGQVGELQAQNTLLVRKLGKDGLQGIANSPSPSIKSLQRANTGV